MRRLALVGMALVAVCALALVFQLDWSGGAQITGAVTSTVGVEPTGAAGTGNPQAITYLVPKNSIGVYSIIPALRVQIGYSMQELLDTGTAAKKLADDVHTCRQDAESGGFTVSTDECVARSLPQGWVAKPLGDGYYGFDVASKQQLPYYDGTDKAKLKPVTYKFALFLG